MKKNTLAKVLYIVVIVAVVALLWSTVTQTDRSTRELSSYAELEKKIEAGEIYGVAMYDSQSGTNVILAVTKAHEQNFKNIESRYDYLVRFNGTETSYDDFYAKFKNYKEQGKLQADLKTLPTPEPSWFMSLLPYLVMLLLTGGLMFFMFQQMQAANGKAAQFGRATARAYDGKNKLGFKDVAGAEEEKEEMSELVDFLKNPKQFTDMGARIPKGVLLVGPPGTGKTLLAKAVAGEAGVPFYSITGSDFVELYVGIGASRVRDLFAQAKRSAPCIIFIDEIDAVGRRRGAGLGGGHDEREQTLNQLLVEMDGFGSHEGIIVMAATNRPDILDPALLRPGRFDRQITVNYPDITGREEILKVHARNKKFEDDVDFSVIAKTTSGFTGADLANLLNEAALLAVRRGKSLIGMQDIEDAFMKVLTGPQKKSRKMLESERRNTAYHEAGHAIVGYYMPTQDPVHMISIIPAGQTLGVTVSIPTTDKFSVYRRELNERIAGLLGGRVAEMLTFGDFSGGASNDIQRATSIAHSMVTQLGMSDELGPIRYGTSHGDDIFLGRDFASQPDYSDETAAKIDAEVHRIINEAFEAARKILTDHADKLKFVAEYLLEHETMDGDQFRAVMDHDATAEELEKIAEDKKNRSAEANRAQAEADKKAEEEKKSRKAEEPDEGAENGNADGDTENTDDGDKQ